MKEQFIIVKYGASFRVNHDENNLTIEALQPGRLYPYICKYVALSQCSIAQFYLAEQRWKGIQLTSLKPFFERKGWLVQSVTKKAALVGV